MMLHQSCRLLNFIHNISSHSKEYSYILHVGLIRRHASILITPKCNDGYKLQVIPNPQKASGNKTVGYTNWKWTLVAKYTSSSGDSKSKEGPNSKKDSEDGQQKSSKQDAGKLDQSEEKILKANASTADPEQKAKSNDKPKEEQKADDSVEKKQVKKRIRVDKSVSSLERNFITPQRAMSEFLLQPFHLQNLPKIKRRSPYELQPLITVHRRKDVEAKAMEVWGTRENLLAELVQQELLKQGDQKDVSTVKRRLRDYRREIGTKTDPVEEQGLFRGSGKVILTAIVINAANFLFKLIAWKYTGSHSMFSECIHSAADTVNQLILAYGIYKSMQNPNPDHPYGYTNMKYVSSLISGVGIFCVGTGLSIYHGVHGLLFPNPIESFYWAYFMLMGSLVSEGATLIMAYQSISKGSEKKNMGFWEYIFEGQDPSVNVVFMEDFAAVIGIVFAIVCMGLTSYFENPVYDAVGSILVGLLLGGVAGIIINTNVAALIGRSISRENLEKINAVLEADVMVRGIHDVKGIDMGNNLVRYKAEIDFDGRELTRSYLDKLDLVTMLQEVRAMRDVDKLEEFLLQHGENIVDTVGGEIDRIELKLKKHHPQIRHCDLEIL